MLRPLLLSLAFISCAEQPPAQPPLPPPPPQHPPDPALDMSVLPTPPKPRYAEATAPAHQSGHVDFRVEQSGPDLPWRYEVTNGLAVPVSVAADRSLLWFEVKAPAAKKPQVCRLPKELLPQEGTRVVRIKLAPGESFEDHFDPRFYCFAPDGQQWLVPGAVVQPRFGWPEAPPKTTWHAGKREEIPVEQKPPYVVDVDDSELGTGGNPVKVLQGPEFALRSEYSEWSRTGLNEPEPRSPLQLTVTRGSDAHAEFNATVDVALANRSQFSKRVFFRRELVTFEVAGPTGSTSCTTGPDERVPDVTAFERLAPGRQMSFTSRLAELCPRGTFSKPGLYLVYARLDANQTGEAQGVEAFTGTLVSNTPALVRIRTGETPFIRKNTSATVVQPGGAIAPPPGAFPVPPQIPSAPAVPPAFPMPAAPPPSNPANP